MLAKQRLAIYESIKDIVLLESGNKFKTKKYAKPIKIIDHSNGKYKEYLLKDKYCKKYFDAFTKKNNGELIIDIETDDVIGYVFVGNKNDKKNTGFIHSLEVNKQYRGYGFGNILIKDAISKLHGYDLTVDKDNEIAIRMYKKHGFIIDKSRETKDRYYMRLK